MGIFLLTRNNYAITPSRCQTLACLCCSFTTYLSFFQSIICPLKLMTINYQIEHRRDYSKKWIGHIFINKEQLCDTASRYQTPACLRCSFTTCQSFLGSIVCPSKLMPINYLSNIWSKEKRVIRKSELYMGTQNYVFHLANEVDILRVCEFFRRNKSSMVWLIIKSRSFRNTRYRGRQEYFSSDISYFHWVQPSRNRPTIGY